MLESYKGLFSRLFFLGQTKQEMIEIAARDRGAKRFDSYAVLIERTILRLDGMFIYTELFIYRMFIYTRLIRVKFIFVCFEWKVCFCKM